MNAPPLKDLKTTDAWRQSITPSPSFISSESYDTAHTSAQTPPSSMHYQTQPLREQLLYNASEGIYSRKVPRKCPSYYKVSIDAEGRQTYCHGKFKKWQFILLHVVVIVILLLFVIIPLAYFVLVPSYIQYRLDSIEAQVMNVDYVMVNDISNQTIGFQVKASLPPFFFWPIKAGFGPCEFTIYDKQRDTMAHLSIPFIEFWLNDQFNLDFSGNLSLARSDIDAIDSIMKSFSADGLTDFSIDAHSYVPLSAMGVQWYSGLSLHKQLDLGDIKSDLKSLSSTIPSLLKNEISTIEDMVPSSDLIRLLPDLGLPPVSIKSFDLNMSDTGMTILTTVLFENPLKLGVKNMKNVEVRVGLEDATMAIIRFKELELKLGFQKLDLEVEILLEHQEIDPFSFHDALMQSSEKILSGKYELVRAAVKGPLHLEGLALEDMTKSLSIWLPVLEIVKQIKATNITELVSTDSIKNTIAGSKLEVSVGSENILVDSKMQIPLIIPLAKINFPYTTYFEIGQSSISSININISPLLVLRQESSVSVDTDILINPINSNAAADTLASAINPLISSSPSDSFIEIYHFGFLDRDGHKFRWCERLFEHIPIKISLPSSLVCKTCIIDSILHSQSGGVSASIPQLSVKQLDLAPGFRTDGSFQINLPTWIPPVILKVGYIQLDLWGAGTTLGTAHFLDGFSFDTRSPVAPFILDIILKREISTPVQVLIDYLFFTDQSPLSPTVGASGFIMGQDSDHQIITFSKIIVDMNLAELLPQIKDVSNTIIRSLTLPGLLKLHGLDFDVQSSTSIAAGFESTLFNPMNLSLDIGSIGIRVSVESESLALVQLPPISLVTGYQPFNIKVDAKVALGGDKPSSAIGAIVEDITHQSQNHGNFPGIEFSGLIIHPKNFRHGPGTIDMLSQIVVKISAEVIHSIMDSILSDMGSANTMIDISPIIPSEDELLAMRPVPKAVEVLALSGSALQAGFSAEYANPLPVSISIPYAEVTLCLGDLSQEMVTVGLSGLDLNRGRGLINLSAHMDFNQLDSELPSKFALFFSNFLSGKISPALGVKKIAFGLNPDEKNTILQDVALDLTVVTDKLGWIGPRLYEYLEEYLTEYIDANNINIHSTLAKRGLSVGLGDQLSVSFEDIDVDFQPSKEIMLHILAKYLMPFDVKVSLPYIGAFVSLDEIPFLRAEIEGIVVNSRAHDNLSLKMRMKMHDGDALVDQLGYVSDLVRKKEPISKSLLFSELVFGKSREDITSVFSQVQVPLPLGSVWKVASRIIDQFTNTVSIDNVVDALGVQIHSFNVRTLPEQTIKCDADVAFNVMNMSVSGLGYFFTDVALTQTPFLSVISPGISFNSGLNTMNVSTNIQFPSSAEIKEKMALLVSDVVSGKLQLVNESSFGISGVTFGTSESDSIRFLKKVQLDIPARLLLNPTILNFVLSTVKKILDTDFDHIVENVLRRLNVYSVNLDASESNHMSFDGLVGVQGIPFKFDLEIGHFNGLATLNEESLASIELVNKLSVRSNNSTVNAAFNGQIMFESGELIQNQVANLVTKIMNNEQLTDNIGGKGLKFGFGENDIIDTFSQSSFYIPVEPLVKLVKSYISPLLDQILKGKSTVGMEIEKLNVDIIEYNTLQANAAVYLVGIPNTIKVNIPFAGATVVLNDRTFCMPKLDLQLAGGRFSTSVIIPFLSDKTNGQKIIDLVRNILWHEQSVPNYVVSIQKVLFGASEKSAFTIASKVNFEPPLGQPLGLLKKYFDEQRPLELYNIPATVVDAGVAGSVTASVLPSFLPLTVSFPLFNAAILYQIEGKGPLIKAANAVFDNVTVSPGKPVNFGVLIEPIFENNAIVDAVKEAVWFMLKDQDYAQNARLGYIVLTGTNGATFDLMDEAYFQAPDLYLYRPWTFDVRASNPISKSGVEVIPLDFIITFPNTGPLHIDLGQIKVSIDAGHEDLIILQSKGSIVIRNVLEGGADGSNPENGIFEVKLPWSNFNPIIFLQNLMELMRRRDFSVDIDVIRPGFGPVKWFNRLVKEVLSLKEIKAFIPVLIAMIGRIHFKLFGIPITHRHAGNFMDRSDEVLSQWKGPSWRQDNDLL